MFFTLLSFFIAFTAAHAFFSAAAIYHLRSYTLPGWSAPKIVIPAYLALSLLFLGLALAALFSL
ncbi:MAG: hypothetical protein HY474_00730 [Candidatus Sungbacteria bacterium]|uniref:Uncharacterized protein n=1 Tax=Candidatus Sungiibacteriota bacterium TaxID=2750080 RepID=A0A932YVJ8_9BACT|nr:hypothetical protein [Candidatus Sungbacteria bacterium]